ncbi:hypothetical protein ZIOFF_009509 [Zingiber officinale]|uniref:TRF2/HOY1 PH-like domain-containing protein n=1 Tax=Zingiber officinale TaxID=94328 RepID=A0A8J5I3S3_ZINOF|nr:hypothetical protein ZIOFF_009509 [Zingiber officinale]
MKLLSQQPDIILESPYFNPQYSVLEDQSDSKCHINDFIKDDSRTTFSGFYEPGPPCATSSISTKTETRDSFGRTLDFDSQDTTSPSSVEELASGNTLLSCDALFDKEITDFLSQFFDNDSQYSADSDEQSIISRGNSLCCLLQQNTVGRMVWSSDSGKRRADSTQHSTPPPSAVKLEVEEPLDEKRVRLHKRIRDASTSCEQALYNNVLGELRPLGKTLCFTSLKGSEVGEQSNFSASPSSLSKIKASNFPTSLLRIGTRKCVSRYEVEDTSLSCDALFDKEITDFILQFFDNDFQSSTVSDEQSFILRGNCLCCLLQQNTVGRMVWSSNSDKRRADSTQHSALPPRWGNSLCCLLQQNTVGGMVWSSDSGKRRADSTQHSTPPPSAVKLEVEEPLDERRVCLHKRIRDASTSCEQALYNNVLGELRPLGKTLCFTSLKGSEVGEQSDFSASPSSLSKIKASNFPTTLLRIGTRKCVSRYEGDLVAKCYFSKHKLVWEVLEGGLKSKIEFHWAIAFAAYSSKIQWAEWFGLRIPASAELVPPSTRLCLLGGELKLLSQQPDIILESPYFNPQYSVLEDQSDSKSHINDFIKDDSRTTFSGFYEPGPPCATSSISNKTETRDSFGRTLDFDSQDTTSPSSDEELASGNTSLSCDALFDNEITDFIPQFFDNDSQSSAASDEQSIISRADSTQHSTPPPPTVKLEVEEPLDEKRVCLHKRIRDASTSCEQALYNNVLGELGPLGLRPRKSRSLADMSQMMLSQANAGAIPFAAYSSKIQWAEWFGFRIPASAELIPPSTQLCLLGGEVGTKSLLAVASKSFTLTIADFFSPVHLARRDKLDNVGQPKDVNTMTQVLGSRSRYVKGLGPLPKLSVVGGFRATNISSKNHDDYGKFATMKKTIDEQNLTIPSTNMLFNSTSVTTSPASIIDYVSSAASDEQSIISWGNSLCYLLQQNTVGGMVWSSDFGKRRADSTQHSTPPPPAVKLEVEEPLDEKRVRLNKRIRDASTLCEQALYNNVLGEPRLLGLRPRKSRSLADMSQMMLSQANAALSPLLISSLLCILLAEDLLLSLNRCARPIASLAAHDQIATTYCRLLGRRCARPLASLAASDLWSLWRCATKSQRLATASLATAAATLLILTSTNMLFNSTSSATSPASIINYVLKLLSQQPDIILESPYFNPQYSVLEDQSDSKSHINDFIKDDSRTTFSRFYEPGPPCATSSISNKTETWDSFGRTLDFDSQDTTSPSSVEELASLNTSFLLLLLMNNPLSRGGNSRCYLLLQNTVGGMVGSSDSGKHRADSIQQSTPPPPVVKLEVEESLDEKRVRLHKKIRDASNSCEQALYNNVLGELGPVGLRPRKSRSLADMSQMMLSQANAGAIPFAAYSSKIQWAEWFGLRIPASAELIPPSTRLCLLGGEFGSGGIQDGVPLDEKRVRLHKRDNNVLGEPGPLGLRPRKSRSLADMSQMMFSQTKAEDQSDSKSHINDFIKDDSRTTFSGFYEPGPPCAASSISNRTETRDSVGKTLDFDSQDTTSASSVEELASGNTSLSATLYSTRRKRTLYRNSLTMILMGGIVWSSDSGKHRADSTQHSTPPPPAVKLEVEEPLDEKRVRLHKRIRDASTSCEQALYNNVLGNLGPLGLRPRKSRSLDDMSQMMLSQANACKTLCFTSLKGSEVGEQSDFSASLSSLRKIKASNFPPSLLRIGTRKCVSRYEGDLVAKCYFAKHKLVWEVLEGRLKCKIKFHCSLIAIKEVIFEGAHGTLDIVLARPPLFFRVTDPQLRKHTPTLTIADFFSPVHLARRDKLDNVLQPKDVNIMMQVLGSRSRYVKGLGSLPKLSTSLSKNFEILINCDAQLKLLSQQPDIILESPYFNPQYSVLEDQSDSKSHINDFIKDDSRTNFSGFYEPGPPCTTSSISNRIETRDSVGKTLDFESQDTTSPSSVEELASGHTSLSCDALFDKEKTDFIPHFFDNDSQSSAASDEQSIISRGNSLCCILQQNTVGGMVWTSDSGKRRADSTQHSTPPPPAVKLEVEEPLDEKRVRLHMRIRDVSTSCEQALYNNVLGDLGRLGLRPRKSRFLADMSQMMLSQANAGAIPFAAYSSEIQWAEWFGLRIPTSAELIPTSTRLCLLGGEGNSLCCLLQQNTVGGKVCSSDSGKRRADSTQHSTQPPPAVKLEVEEPLDEKRVRLYKRIRDASTSCEQALYNNVLGELGPVGLRPRKSRSLADMSQMMLSQANASKNLCFTSLKGSEVGEQSDFSASPSSLSKIKASNFPTSLLRIGIRKCVSRYEVEDTSLSCDALFDKEITDIIPQFFDNDSQSSAVSDEQSIISRGNSLCCLLQQNTVGRMVWSSNFGKRRADSTQHSALPPRRTLTIADFFSPVHLARRDKLDNVRQPKDVNIMTQVLGSRSRYVKGLCSLPKLSVVSGSRATNISSKHLDDFGKFATMKETIDEQNLTIPLKGVFVSRHVKFVEHIFPFVITSSLDSTVIDTDFDLSAAPVLSWDPPVLMLQPATNRSRPQVTSSPLSSSPLSSSLVVGSSTLPGSDASSVDVIVCKLHTKFTIKDFGALYLFCSIEVRPTSNGLLLSQQKYITDILSKHNMLDSKSVSTPIAASSHLTLHDGSSSFDTTKF